MRIPITMLAAAALLCAGGARADGFTLASASFGPNATLATKQVYDDDGCNGGNVSPELHWSGAPEGTKSYAITMFDPDAGGGSGWWHWLVFDIDAKTTALDPGAGDANAAPAGSVSGTNSFGDVGYSGPCPPRDEKAHRYVFTVYALRTAHLGLPPHAKPAAVKAALERSTILSTTLQGVYGR